MKLPSIVLTGLLGLLLLPVAVVAQDGKPVPFEDDPLIQVGDTVSHQVEPGDTKLGPKGSGMWYRLDVENSGPITVDVVSYDFDVQLAVLDHASAIVIKDAKGGVEWNAHAVFEAEAGAMYRIGGLAMADMAGELEVSVREGEFAAPVGLDMERARVEFRQRVAARAGERGDVAKQALLLVQAGNIGFGAGLFDEAEPPLREGARLTKELGDAGNEAFARAFLGGIHARRGDDEPARSELERALELAQEDGNPAIEEFVRDNLATVLGRGGHHAEAVEQLEAMAESARAAGHAQNEGIALTKLGEVRVEQGMHAEARESFRVAMERAEEIGNPEVIADAWLALGNFHKNRNEFGAAADAYEAGLAVAPPGDAQMALVGGLGTIHLSSGRYAEARMAFLDVLVYFEDADDKRNAAVAHMNLGIVAMRLGDYTAALEEYETSRELHGEAVSHKQLFALYTNIASAWNKLEKTTEEHNALDAAHAAGRQTGNPVDEAIALRQLGWFEQQKGRYGEARELLDQALGLLDSERDAWAYSAVLGAMAELDLETGDAGRAISNARDAADMAFQAGDPAMAVDSLDVLADAAIAKRDVGLASDTLDEIEEILERPLPRSLGSEEAAGVRSRFAPLAEVEQDLVALRLDQLGKREAAAGASIIEDGFQKTGRWKGRALLEGIAEHRRGGRSGPAAELRVRLSEVYADHAGIRRGLAQAVRSKRPAGELLQFESRLEELDQSAAELTQELESIAPRDAALDSPRGRSAGDVRSALLGDGRILVDYVAGKERLYAYVLTAEGLEFVRLGEREAIEAEISAYLADMSDPTDLGTVKEIVARGLRLHESLLQPVVEAAGGDVAEILIVPFGDLATLPFEALVLEGKRARTFEDVTFALDRWAIGYGPSSPVLVALADVEDRSGADKVLVLGDPVYPVELPATARIVMRGPPRMGELSRLMGTRDEAVSIADVVLARSGEDDYEEELESLRTERSVALTTDSIDVFLGGEATPERLHGNLTDYSVVHCASHGFVDTDNPKMSGLALAFGDNTSGYLPMADVLELHMDADLTVLSACQTAQGSELEGEGLQTMARAFIYAGSRAVVASLWQVSDRETGATMSALYERHMTDGLPLWEALRAAKLSLRRGTLELSADDTRRNLRGDSVYVDPRRVENVTTGHPYYWAPFIHVGRQ